MSWTYDRLENGYGLFFVFARNNANPWTDITFVRGAPIQINELTYADPFSDSTAQFSVPSVPALDGYRKDNELWWLRPFTNIDVYFYPALPTPTGGPAVYNPDTMRKDLYLQVAGATPIWQGFIVSLSPSSQGTQITCQGALYQLDRYYSKPYYPKRPVPMELLIKRQFDLTRRPGLFTADLIIDWPGYLDGTGATTDSAVNGGEVWARRFTDTESKNVDYLTPTGLNVGDLYTGYSTRNTGEFNQALTGYVQSLLAMMYTAKDSYQGGPQFAGRQWTVLMNARGNPSASPIVARQPVLQVRNPDRAPDAYVWYGQPGVEGSFSQDGSTQTNVVYGQGTGVDGVDWKRMKMIGFDAQETEFMPLAYGQGVYPYSEANKDLMLMPMEKYVSFPNGVSQAEGYSVARQWILRDADPGWTGTLTLSVDPLDPDTDQPISRWLLRPGMTLLLRGFVGTWKLPIRLFNKFHIAEVTLTPQDGTVTLRLDSKYRDLLTLEEVQARVRDPLTPVKALRVNSRSVLIDDIGFQWDYSAGSGFLPRHSLAFYQAIPPTANFPYQEYTTLSNAMPRAHPLEKQIYNLGSSTEDSSSTSNLIQPGKDDNWYSQGYFVAVCAGASTHAGRWSGAVPILTSQAGTIRRTQLAVYHQDGSVCTHCEFHFSIYAGWIGIDQMPHENNEPDPFTPNAFQTINPDTGLPFPSGSSGGTDSVGNQNMPEAASNMFIIGWGAGDAPAGYSPRTYSAGLHPTGMLLDEGTWTYNNVSSELGKIDPNQLQLDRTDLNSITLWAMIYARVAESAMSVADHNAQYGKWVYFLGRLFKSVAGTS